MDTLKETEEYMMRILEGLDDDGIRLDPSLSVYAPNEYENDYRTENQNAIFTPPEISTSPTLTYATTRTSSVTTEPALESVYYEPAPHQQQVENETVNYAVFYYPEPIYYTNISYAPACPPLPVNVTFDNSFYSNVPVTPFTLSPLSPNAEAIALAAHIIEQFMLSNLNKQGHPFYTRADIDSITSILASPHDTSLGSYLHRFWVRESFKLASSSAGLVAIRSTGRGGLPVLAVEDMAEVIVQTHISLRHGGRDKTYNKLKSLWHGVPKQVVADYVGQCPQCRKKVSSKRVANLKRGRSKK